MAGHTHCFDSTGTIAMNYECNLPAGAMVSHVQQNIKFPIYVQVCSGSLHPNSHT